RGCQLLANTRIDGEIEVWFKNPAPSYADFMRGKYSALRFDMPVTQLRFPAALLQAKLAMHNPTGLAFAIRQCEQENALQAESALKIRERVRREVVLGPNGYPSQAEVAQRLKMTTRTMRRHLDKEGVKFSELLDQAKRRDAIRLLDDSEAEIQNVAAHLGYQEPANFTRAFRQWTGQSPSEYRQTRKDSR
ncbi:MAG: helix-turn-helix domain-containing protein, partial [Nevskiales bacterium]